MKVSEERLRILKANNEESHRETCACIKGALVELLQKKRYDDISMTEIIMKSGVSRSGVYKNYKNKNAIMLDIYREPIDEVISALDSSVFDNLETIFRTGKKHRKAIETLLDSGLEHNLLRIMNERYEGSSVSFYIPLWIGMIYNGFIEWARSDMDEPVESAVERVRKGLSLVADSIETGLTNDTQNKRLYESTFQATS